MPLESLLSQLYGGQERLTRDEIQRRAVLDGVSAEQLTILDRLPEGEYAQDEVSAALADLAGTSEPDDVEGVPSSELSDEDLFREMGALHRTRSETLRHGSAQAFERHTERMAELEAEYLIRYPEREVDPERERSGARQR
jgi:hypothetical protein